MTKADNESLLTHEVRELINQIGNLSALSLELQYHGQDLKNYRYSLKQALAYCLTIDPDGYEYSDKDFGYCDKKDLQIETDRVLENFEKISLAYNHELFAAIKFHIALMKHYANK